jgi:hypothetical protein
MVVKSGGTAIGIAGKVMGTTIRQQYLRRVHITRARVTRYARE